MDYHNIMKCHLNSTNSLTELLFAGWENPPTGLSDYPTASPREQRIIDLPNKIYTSEINNPFHFPVLGINTIGTGTILGISSAVKALSEGQFGQFPLYAFTSEGVSWR